MINSPDFIKRLQIIIDYYQLSAATLADKIDVQRSSISHLLSGRNKPSLDFVLKLIKQFPEINLYWLLNGLGNFPATLSENFQPKKDMVLDSENINTNKSNNGETRFWRVFSCALLSTNQLATPSKWLVHELATHDRAGERAECRQERERKKPREKVTTGIKNAPSSRGFFCST